MSIPWIFEPKPDNEQIELSEESSRHLISVLRMKKGEVIKITDGKGSVLECEIAEPHKKHCKVNPKSKIQNPKSVRSVTIGISLIKNSSRFEWFLEKATEIGVNSIIPLICERTEKQKFKQERGEAILVSAMLQSQQAWLPELQSPKKLAEVIQQATQAQKFIAHCDDDEKRELSDLINTKVDSQIILIGPEGDFTQDEINEARTHHFTGVSLGNHRLRTETAGIAAAVILCIQDHE